MIGEHNMYVTLRVGPFIEAEWNYGYGLVLHFFWLYYNSLFEELSMPYLWSNLCSGFPYWLREVSNITFRSDNPPFKVMIHTLQSPSYATLHIIV